jgi:hypothetical protein
MGETVLTNPCFPTWRKEEDLSPFCFTDFAPFLTALGIDFEP